MNKALLSVLSGGAVMLLSLVGKAEVEFDWGASIGNDFRVAVKEVDEATMYRNETDVNLNLNMGLIPDRLRFVGDLKFVWTGFAKDTDFNGLTERANVAPVYLESNAAYIDILDILPSLDLRLGRQIVQWGTADMFNPTNNLNALDLEDPLRFGEVIANQMVRLDYNPGGGNLIFTAVWVPVFQPSQLPRSGNLRVGDPSSELPFVDPEDRLEAEALRNIYLKNPDAFEIYTPVVHANMPEYSLSNSQVGFKMQWLIGDIDTSLSYYLGRDTLPVSVASYSTQEFTDEYYNGAPVLGVGTDVDLYFPKKQVIGFDLAGQIPFLDDMGFWFEGAVTFPEEVAMDFDITEVVTNANVITGNVVDGTPFFKCTVGADYSINQYLFVTGQFIHGFPDEFGATAIQNYWMGVLDLKLLQERLTIRNVVMGEIPHEDDDLPLDEDNDGLADSFAIGATSDGDIASIVYYPELIIRPLDGLELSIGAFLKWGHAESKFAMAAAGPSQLFFRARASF